MKKLLFGAIAAVICLSSCNCNNGTRLPKVRPESVGINSERLVLADSIINKAIDDTIIPGAVLAIVRDDKLAYLKAYGNKQIIPSVEPMTTETVFDLASLSKCVGTTLSFMQLIDNGQVRVCDDVSRYIPGFAPWTDPETGKQVEITIQDLMTHSSGLPAYVNVKKCKERFVNTPAPDSLINYISFELPRLFRPSTGFNYSCLNFVTLQNVLQNVTGERLCDYAKKNVFDELGLKHTCYLPIGEPIDPEFYELIAPTELQEDGLPYHGQVHDPIANILNGGNSGNAGVFSNAEDLAVIAAAIMNGGAYGNHRILSPMATKAMCTVPQEDYTTELGRTLGWDCYSSHAGIRGDLLSRHNIIGHTGYTGTSMVIDLDAKMAVILLTNRCHPYDTGGLGRTRATLANVIASSIIE